MSLDFTTPGPIGPGVIFFAIGNAYYAGPDTNVYASPFTPTVHHWPWLSGSPLQYIQLLRRIRQYQAARFCDHHRVLNANPAPVRDIDARFHSDDVAGLKC